ncbi:MAG: prephenate dehydratase domain-containing protein, partial [Erysipelotrichaceae bacterium]|nr:prephenate dehydratase domain-containing protein [Erysipelotrichaceae bacterium]
GDRSKAALGSWRAREYYGMESLLERVQDLKTNVTRFLVIAPAAHPYPEDADKISMMMVLNHRPGALYNILGILAKNGVNVLKLESRPIAGAMFEYLFYIDFEGNIRSRAIAAMIHEMELRCLRTRILGCYKRAEI